MKKLFLIMAVATTLVACDKNGDVERESIDTQVCLVFLDKDSTDLLNPDNPNGYKFSEMGLYKDLELRDKRTNGWHFDSGEGCFSSTNLELKLYYYILFGAPKDYMEKREGKTVWCATSYLKLNETTVDTIYTEVLETPHSETLIKVLYNGVDVTRLGLVVKKDK